MEAAESASQSGGPAVQGEQLGAQQQEEEIQFVCESITRPVLDIIDLVSSDEEESSSSQVVRKVKPKDYIDLQKDRVASTLDRLARHVEEERKEKEARTKDFLERNDSQHAHGLQELELIKGHVDTTEARRCVDHWLKMPGLRPGSVNTGRRRSPAGEHTPVNNNPITCPVLHCNRKFDNGHLLLGHLKRFDHSPCDPTITLHGTPTSSYACVVCFKRFTTQQQYKDHLLIKTAKIDGWIDDHSKNPPPHVIQCFACPTCFLLFNVRDECLQHMSARNHFLHHFKLSGEKELALPIAFPSYAKNILISMCKEVPFQVCCTACQNILHSDKDLTAHFKTRCRTAGPAALSEKSICQVAEIFLLKGHCVSCRKLFSSDEQVNQHKERTNHNARLVTTIQESVLIFCYINEGFLNPAEVSRSVGQHNLKSSILKRAHDHLGSKCGLLKDNKHVKSNDQAIQILPKPENKCATKIAWFCECSQKFETDQAAEKHLLSANGIGYKCMVCGKKAEEATVINLHMSRFHGGAHLKNFIFWCNACNTEMPRKESAMGHIAECHSDHTYYYDQEVLEDEPSPSTSKILMETSQLQISSNILPSSVDSAGGKWECRICEERFDCEETIQKHCQSLGSHQFHKVCCDLCKMRFHKVETLYRHCQDRHNGEIKVKYVCGLCDDLFFVGEQEFCIHYTDLHSRDYAFVPEHADVSIKDQGTLPSTSPENSACLTCGCLENYSDKHRRKEDIIKCKENLLVKGTLWYSCSMCKATAQKKANILKHFTGAHNINCNQAPFMIKCGTCSKTFSDLDGAQQHYHNKHSFLQKPNMSHHFGFTEAHNGVFRFTASGACVAKQHGANVLCHLKGVQNSIKPSKVLSRTEPDSSSNESSRESESQSMDSEQWPNPSEYSELPDLDYLRTMTHIVFVDLDNWSTFFKRLPGQLNQGTFVWGFQGGKHIWKPPENCPVFNYLEKIGTFFLHPRCSDRKDAADFAICMHAGRMDEQLPKQIPFTVLSGDKGFLELKNQFEKTQRPAHILNPHHINGEMMCALLNSIADTSKECDEDTEEDCDIKLTMELTLKELNMTKDEKEPDEEADMKEAIRRSLAEI